jgi:hypothetical protein
MLKPYMGYSRWDGPVEGAILIFAHSVREAKKIGCRDGNITDEYVDFAVNLIRYSPWLFKDANQEKLQSDTAHVIDSPTGCKRCELWGNEIGEDGLCEDCREEVEQEYELKEGDGKVFHSLNELKETYLPKKTLEELERKESISEKIDKIMRREGEE